jgi:hypothetical protein
MARKVAVKKEVKPLMIYVPIDSPAKLYPGRKIHIRINTHIKYSPMEIRDRVLLDHKKGYHEGESVEQYEEYRKQMDQWCIRGWLFDHVLAPTDEDKEKLEQESKTTVKVSVNPQAYDTTRLFNLNEDDDKLGLKSFTL